MTGGVIAAIAFLILAIFISIFLMVLLRTFHEVNQSVAVIRSSVDVLSKQVEDILGNANELLDDVNHKVATVDPVFQAAADLGESVSDLNNATRDLTTRVTSTGKSAGKVGVATKAANSVYKMYRNHQTKKQSRTTNK
ncbi:DUF948 domain-containing protein [Furfurilactobacillus rossiae]|uniref:Methyl-accepting chemotaxis-like protein n=1 Tax=Furfurilactobacillus rossiae DSM 15814 TaxID=1114972 RepID=A0A0R1RBT0_9LACO|nr:DUF948 domain-containing protein [Furfurilactobacillus rossiae]KRL54145.1 methyl-accepting chemotaxis-like protein [Furfurilactobacillus rossiae DSM 15814]QFR66301.1 DUF948 domain-containing protein [Furfurilactobacillus rossiae]QLE61751.1 General stress protein [Furfurilactobacillus rossiae]